MKYLKKYWSNSFIFILAVVCPTSFAFASIKITEVAWMGTTESQYGEWIELYNDSEETKSLEGWKLYTDNGATLLFTLKKEIPGKSYLVIERTTPSVPDPLPGIADESGSFGGGLSNSGEHLILRNSSGALVDELVFANGWPAGDAATKQTMQRSGSAWVTATATPTKAFSGSEAALPPAASSTGTASSGSTSVSAPKPAEPKITFTHPDFFIAGVEALVKGVIEIPGIGLVQHGYFVWSTGDGYSKESNQLTPLVHQFQYPGEYTVTLAHFASFYAPEPTIIGHFTARVIATPFVVSLTKNNEVMIQNKGKDTVDLYRWSLVCNSSEFIFPRYTYLTGGNAITIPFARFSAGPCATLPILFNPSKDPSSAVGFTQQTITISSPSGPASSFVSNKKVTSLTRRAPVGDQEILKESTTPDASALATGSLGETKNNQRTWLLIAFGALIAVSIGLFLLLERFKAQQE